MEIDYMNKMINTILPIDEDYIEDTLIRREGSEDKESFGRLNVVAGSYGMVGAAILAGRAAFKMGVGLVTFHSPAKNISVLQTSLPEAMCIERDVDNITSSMKHFVLGPGLGDDSSNLRVMEKIFAKKEGSIILDADGINNLTRYDLLDDFSNSKLEKVITPHEGEAKKLLGIDKIGDKFGIDGGENTMTRRETVKVIGEMTGAIAVLKGKDTLVYDGREGGKIYMNLTGNVGMATAGSGDVLSGMIGSLLAQGYDPLDAALIGVYVHGMAGDYARDERGEISLMAGDIVDNIERAVKHLYG